MTGTLRLAPARVAVDYLPDGSTLLTASAPLQQPPATLFTWLDHWADHWADVGAERTWVTEVGPDGERTALGYRDARDTAQRLAAYLSSSGLRPGDRVVIALGNSIEHLLWSLAVMRAGAIYAALPPQYVGPHHDEAKLEALMTRVDPFVAICSDETQAARFPSGVPTRTSAWLLQEAENAPTSPPPTQPTTDSLAKLVFTSGSSGEPKVVPYRHGQMTAEITMTRQCWPFLDDQAPVLLDWLPWNHSFGGTVSLYLVLASGGTLHIDDGGPTPAGVRRTLEQVGALAPTIHFAVPSTLALIQAELAAHPELAACFFRSVRAIFTAGAALHASTFEALEQLARDAGHQVTMLSGWGNTEAGPGATIVHAPDARPGWIGLPMPGVQIKLVPEAGKLHLTVRGPNVFTGYWRDDAATEAAFDADGFFRTGDAGRLVDCDRPDRGLTFDGRIGDDFKLANGTWINYAQVRERLLGALAGQAADVVIGLPDATALVALVWPAEGARLDDSALQAALDRHNAACHRPSDRLCALAVLTSPPDGDEITPKNQLRPRHVREHRPLEFQALLEKGTTR